MRRMKRARAATDFWRGRLSGRTSIASAWSSFERSFSRLEKSCSTGAAILACRDM